MYALNKHDSHKPNPKNAANKIRIFCLKKKEKITKQKQTTQQNIFKIQ